MKFSVFAFTLLFVVGSAAAENWSISEDNLVQLLKKDVPAMQNVDAALSEQNYEVFQLNSRYRWNWNSQAQLQDSDEDSIAAFIPTFGPTYRFSTGVSKKTSKGALVDLQIFTDQQTAVDAGIDKATRTGIQFNASFDLWKNLFGRLDQAEQTKQNLRLERIKLQNHIQKRAIELDLRKIYWSLVANNEQINISQALLTTSKKQLQDGLKRRGQFIADKGEIARFKAQVAERQAAIDTLKVTRGLFLQSLKEQVPSLANKEIVVGTYDIEKKVEEVLACTQRIKTETSVPWDYTKVDEVIGLIEKSFDQDQLLNERLSDLDVSLDTQAQISGVDQGYGDSIDRFTDNGKFGYAMLFKVSVPLGNDYNQAKLAKDRMQRQRFLAEKSQFRAQAKAQHTQIVAMVDLLLSSVHQLAANSASLKNSIVASEQKFKQARIPLSELIADQDALFRSLNSEIQSKLNVVHIILDYFKTFTEDPCSINKLGV